MWPLFLLLSISFPYEGTTRVQIGPFKIDITTHGRETNFGWDFDC